MAFSFFGILKGILLQNEVDRTKQVALQASASATTGTTMTITSAQSTNRTLTLPDATDTLTGKATTDTLTNKSIDGGSNTLTNIAATSLASTTGSGSTVVLATGPTLTNPIVGTQSQLDGSTKAASTSYVDVAVSNAVAGLNPAVAVQAATTAASDTSGFTYTHVAGVGDFFTGSVATAVTIDGFTFTALGQRLLVKNDTQSPSGAFNGVYYVTQLQTGILPPVLTRALDYDAPSDINNTGAIPVVNGTVNATTSWVQTAQVVTVGTTPLVFAKFSRNPTDYLLVANNLSDVASKSTSFNNLSPMTTGGDIIYGGASGTGTRLANGSNGQVLTSGGGTAAPSWTAVLTNPMTTGGDIIYGGASGTPTRLANGSSTQQLVSAGGTSAPQWLTLTPTNQTFTSQGTQAGRLFYVSGVSTSPSAGDTYTNNSVTYTVIGISDTKSHLWMTNTGGTTTTSGSTLTRTAGAGDATITFNTSQAISTYTRPANCTLLKVTSVGAGGGSGGVASSASTASGGGGGGGGGTCIKWISSPASSYYYTVGPGGFAAASGANAGGAGGGSAFGNNSTFYFAGGGSGGSGGTAAGGIGFVVGGSAGGSSLDGDINITGGDSGPGYILSTSQASGGYGGNSTMGGGPKSILNTNSPGTAGYNYGGGAAGACQVSAGGAQTGSIGAGGIVIIEEFYT